jgi:hypothetical protein
MGAFHWSFWSAVDCPVSSSFIMMVLNVCIKKYGILDERVGLGYIIYRLCIIYILCIYIYYVYIYIYIHILCILYSLKDVGRFFIHMTGQSDMEKAFGVAVNPPSAGWYSIMFNLILALWIPNAPNISWEVIVPPKSWPFYPLATAPSDDQFSRTKPAAKVWPSHPMFLWCPDHAALSLLDLRSWL